MIKGTTQTGFDYEIEDEAFNDMRVMDALMEMDEIEGEESEQSARVIFLMSKVATLLLGGKQKKKLYDHVVNIHGKVTMDAFVNEMTDILAGDQAKK